MWKYFFLENYPGWRAICNYYKQFQHVVSCLYILLAAKWEMCSLDWNWFVFMAFRNRTNTFLAIISRDNCLLLSSLHLKWLYRYIELNFIARCQKGAILKQIISASIQRSPLSKIWVLFKFLMELVWTSVLLKLENCILPCIILICNCGHRVQLTLNIFCLQIFQHSSKVQLTNSSLVFVVPLHRNE